MSGAGRPALERHAAPTELSAAGRAISEAWLVTMRLGSAAVTRRASYVINDDVTASPNGEQGSEGRIGNGSIRANGLSAHLPCQERSTIKIRDLYAAADPILCNPSRDR